MLKVAPKKWHLLYCDEVHLFVKGTPDPCPAGRPCDYQHLQSYPFIPMRFDLSVCDSEDFDAAVFYLLEHG